MDAKSVNAGLGAGLVGLLTRAVVGTYGGWAPVFELASTQFGFWVIALVSSVAFAYVYAYVGFPAFLPGTTLVKGAIFGALVWVLMLILGGVFEFFKEATYPDPSGPTVFLTLVLHLVWGSVLALLYEVRS